MNCQRVYHQLDLRLQKDRSSFVGLSREDAEKLLEYVKHLEYTLAEAIRFAYEKRDRERIAT